MCVGRERDGEDQAERRMEMCGFGFGGDRGGGGGGREGRGDLLWDVTGRNPGGSEGGGEGEGEIGGGLRRRKPSQLQL